MNNGVEIIKCQNCDKIFYNKIDLKYHTTHANCSKNNIIEKLNKSPVRSFPCNLCDLSFTTKQNLTRHLTNTKTKCYKNKLAKEENPYLKLMKGDEKYTINNYNNQTYNNNQITNNNQQITNNNQYITNQNIIQPIINNIHPVVVLAKHGKETTSHITKEMMLKLLDTKSFTGMCTELMRLMYFNNEVPENQNWTIIYPKNKKAGLQLNYETNKFERVATYNIIDDKFDNMIELLLPLIEEIDEEDKIKFNLNEDQRKNILRFGRHYGMEISKESEEIYESVHNMAYNSRKVPMKTWGEQGHSGNHLSLKF
jgi:hypothetical protein